MHRNVATCWLNAPVTHRNDSISSSVSALLRLWGCRDLLTRPFRRRQSAAAESEMWPPCCTNLLAASGGYIRLPSLNKSVQTRSILTMLSAKRATEPPKTPSKVAGSIQTNCRNNIRCGWILPICAAAPNPKRPTILVFGPTFKQCNAANFSRWRQFQLTCQSIQFKTWTKKSKIGHDRHPRGCSLKKTRKIRKIRKKNSKNSRNFLWI